MNMVNTLIRQSLLQDYYNISMQKRELQRKYKMAREEILLRAASGAPLEPGGWAYRVQETVIHNVTKQKLVDAFGLAECSRILAALAPSVQQRIRVFVACVTSDPDEF